MSGVGSINVWGSTRNWVGLNKGANCKLLIHSDTTDGSTTFVDTIGTHNPLAGGTAQHDTAQKKWGASSILLDGDSDYVTVADHADWEMGSGAFTIDFWLRLVDAPGFEPFFQQRESDTLRVSAGINTTSLFLYVNDGHATNKTVELEGTATLAIGTWYHIAFVRGWEGGANTWAIVVNGSVAGTLSDDSAWPSITGALEIGRYTQISGGGDLFFNGWIDEFRVVKGTAAIDRSGFRPYGPYR